jgi:serine protease
MKYSSRGKKRAALTGADHGTRGPHNFRRAGEFQGRRSPADEPLMRRLVIPALLLVAALAATFPHAARADDAFRPGEIVVKRHGQAATIERPHAGETVEQAIARLRAQPGVDSAARNAIAHMSQSPPTPAPEAPAPWPNDPGPSAQPGGWKLTQWNFYGPASVNAAAAWGNLAKARRTGGRGTIVAVLDTGVAYRNAGRFKRSPDFGRSDFVRGYDFVGHDSHPDDENGHGTHVASTIGEGVNNGIGLTGLAYGARIMPVRVLDSIGEGDVPVIARGVRWAADHGANVINLSLEFSPEVRARDIPELLSAIRYARSKRVVVVGASGNEGHAAVAYPARASTVLAVGATTERGCLSDYSNEGSGLDIVAPGGGRDAVSPTAEPGCNPALPGRPIVQLTYTSGIGVFGYPDSYEGTSMAAPHVAAAAALVIASGVVGRRPTAAAVEKRLTSTARDLGTPGYDKRYGWGLLDAGAATDPNR